MKSKLMTWLVVGLGALGVAFLSGAFETFFNWDRTQSKIGSGLFTAGVALAGAYLAHAGGIIDGDTRNMVIAAGVAVGATQALGGKVYEWGSDLAAKVGKRSARKAPTDDMRQPDNSSYDGGGGGQEFTGQVPDGPNPADMAFAFKPPTGTTTAGPSPQPAGGAAPSAAPVYHINVEAAKIPKPDMATTVIQTLGGVAESFFGSGIFGSKGSGRGNRRAVPLGAL